MEALSRKPVAITAPTGSGKSTQIPRWCKELGKVLVVEPRRVACRGLAQWVAELENTALGQQVGYTVRDDRQASKSTRIHFATPGIVLRWLSSNQFPDFQTVILDEFHERGLETDLLLALFLKMKPEHLVVMSATMDVQRIAGHIRGEAMEASGRLHPVTVRYLPVNAFLPEIRGIEDRVLEAIRSADDDAGDFLIFMPGKGEIRSVTEALRKRTSLEVLEVHGGLSLSEQGRLFEKSNRRRAVVATNVAETSITIPKIGIVIDSGLVRRTRYHQGRGYLTLSPIALDSADQRAGRAGRLGPGVCLRLWNKQAVLESITPPEIHRENLGSLGLAARSCGEDPTRLAFLDPPKHYALEQADEDLAAIGALDSSGKLTQRGQMLFGLPLDAPLGALMVEAEVRGVLDDAIDLVSVLSVGKPLFHGTPKREKPDDIGYLGCDVVARILAMRRGFETPRVQRSVLQEALVMRKRLREAWALPVIPPRNDNDIDRRKLALTALHADWRNAHVPRRRKRKTGWSNGGTELVLGRDSLVDEQKTQALVVLDTHAVGVDYRKRMRMITCAMPVPTSWLLEAGLGEDEVGRPAVQDSIVVARVHKTFAGSILSERDDVPQGELARIAATELLRSDRFLTGTWELATRRLAERRLFRQLHQAGLVPKTVGWEVNTDDLVLDSLPTETWFLHRLEELGFQDGNDAMLLEAGDLLPQSLPASITDWMSSEFPQRVDIGDANYRCKYDLAKRQVQLERLSGNRKTPPQRAFLPRFGGFKIVVLHGTQSWSVH